jgi:hypothetical protein
VPSRGGEHLLDPEVADALEVRTIDAISVPEEIPRRGVLGESPNELLGGPLGAGIRGHVEVDNPAAIVGQDEQCEKLQASFW